MVKHALGDTAYRERVAECKAAAEAVRARDPEVQSLRDATLEHLGPVEAEAGAVVFRRARHVITENRRVRDFAAAAAQNNVEAMGRLFVESHRSLQHDYEVSCAELDFLVDQAISRRDWVYGARMTGGGFGGSTVNLVRAGRSDEFTRWISETYRKRYRIEPQVYRCKPSAGAGEIGLS
jgi:galactokinase